MVDEGGTERAATWSGAKFKRIHRDAAADSLSGDDAVKVLLVSFAFPPSNVIGAVRVGKIAKYLIRFGHDVRVLSARDAPFPPTLALEIPATKVTYTSWARVDGPLRLASALAGRFRTNGDTHADSHVASATGNGSSGSRPPRRLAWLADRYQDFVCIPDDSIGWLPSAYREGQRLVHEFGPDVIFASGKPWTSLVVAHRIATSTGVPWVAELRDPWGGNPYDNVSSLRARVDDWLSRRTMRSASGVVTVSPPLVDVYARKYAKPTTVVMSGYDLEDEPAQADGVTTLRDDGRLWLVHAGSFYAQRDLSALVIALQQLGDDARRVRITLLGAEPSGVEGALALARKLGVPDCFEVTPAVSRAESLRIQRAADVLLLAMWNDPREYTFLPGKLFEYVGARRPILLVGLVNGAAAQLVTDRGLGVAFDEPVGIARWLIARIAEKDRMGRAAAPPSSGLDGLAYEAQVRRLEEFLARAAGAVAR